MYWSWNKNGVRHASWGQPRLLDDISYTALEARFDVPVYAGNRIGPGESMVMMMQGDATLGLGDSIWLMNYMRDVWNVKSRRRGEFTFVSSPSVAHFYSNFLPQPFHYVQEYLKWTTFEAFNHKLPSMYYWNDPVDGAARSWLDNKSILERLYDLSGMEYRGLLDWGDFTNEELLYPSSDFYERLNINKNDRYVFLQWHSSGHAKNMPPSTNLKIINHIVKTYGLKVYVVGKLTCLDAINNLPGVVNLSGKTELEDLIPLAFNSDFIVCPDSAGMHLSEAYKIPCVCVMSTLPPVYVASKYKIPAFMFGSGFCPFRPCGVVHALPKETKCPSDTGRYCKVMEDLDLEVFDASIVKSFNNRAAYRSKASVNFYESMNQPISLCN